jgi:hypothetical protein
VMSEGHVSSNLFELPDILSGQIRPDFTWGIARDNAQEIENLS